MAESVHVEKHGIGLRVIGAGLGRTGTESLQTALEILYDAPCYHMSANFKHGDTANWIADGGPKFDKIFSKRPDGIQFAATVDYPACAYVEELMHLYPDALVLLSVRDTAEQWASSVSSTILKITKIFAAINMATFGLWPFFRNFIKMADVIFSRTLGYSPTDLDEARLVQGYHSHNSRIRKMVPAEKLLEFNVKQGWGPLCSRLGLPVPNVPFPHQNERGNFMSKWLPKLFKLAISPTFAVTVIIGVGSISLMKSEW